MHDHGTVEQFTMASYLRYNNTVLCKWGVGYLTVLFSDSDLCFKLNGIFAKPAYLLCSRHQITKVMYQDMSEFVLVVANN
jgi:hypothetical protein